MITHASNANMNILILGSGGREHSIIWAISKSPKCKRLLCAPGNPGIAKICNCVLIDIMDSSSVIGLCRREAIDFVIIGPEAPLVAGMVDVLHDAGIRVFGPTASAARLEGSKGFTKDLCRKHNIPTAKYRRFANLKDTIDYVKQQIPPIVVKVDKLAAGKGVTIASDSNIACDAVRRIFNESSVGSDTEVVIEEYLEGEEASLFVLTDGKVILPLASAQDHKRAFDGDLGPNTGGMGAYSPAAILDHAMTQRVIDEIIEPTIRGMSLNGSPFKGVLYAGLMITSQGPKLIEYNVRFGDPECQTIMVRLKDDLLELLLATVEERLINHKVTLCNDTSITVVMVNTGYPETHEKGSEIKCLDKAAQIDGVTIFHAGTSLQDNRLIATGGRVINVTAMGKTVAEAHEKAYTAIQQIDWPEGFYRKDIGWRAMKNHGEGIS